MTTQDNLTCPICEADALQLSSYTGTIENNGKTIRMPDLECYECSACGADPVFPEQARRNNRRYQDARRELDGLLTGDEIVALRKRLGLTQPQAATVFGGGRNAFSKYERGEVIQSIAMDRLLRLAAWKPEVFIHLKALAADNLNFGFQDTSITAHERSIIADR